MNRIDIAALVIGLAAVGFGTISAMALQHMLDSPRLFLAAVMIVAGAIGLLLSIAQRNDNSP